MSTVSSNAQRRQCEQISWSTDWTLLIASRPQLVHSTSKQSVTASDDYYSLTSDQSSNEDRPSRVRYETPPLHNRPEQPAREQTTSPLGHQSQEEQEGQKSANAPASPHTEGHTIKRKPVSVSSDGTAVQRPLSEGSPPTPGVDDTPYIQFAIDQLTRDEEVAGSRRHSLVQHSKIDTIGKTEPDEERMLAPPPIPPSDMSYHPRESWVFFFGMRDLLMNALKQMMMFWSPLIPPRRPTDTHDSDSYPTRFAVSH